MTVRRAVLGDEPILRALRLEALTEAPAPAADAELARRTPSGTTRGCEARCRRYAPNPRWCRRTRPSATAGFPSCSGKQFRCASGIRAPLRQRPALWGFLWVDTAGSERTLATQCDLAVSLGRLGATCWESAGQERKRMERLCRPLPYHLATAPGYAALELMMAGVG